MSVSTAKSTLHQIEHQIEKLEKDKSNAEAEAAKLGKQISSKEIEISKATSASSVRTKQSQLKTLIERRNKCNSKAADAGSKLAKLTEKKHKVEAALREEQQKEHDKETQRLQITIRELTDQLEGQATLREPNMIMQCVRPLIERYPDAIVLFDSGAEKYEGGGADRNALDDMRLCFEKVLQSIFSNEKSLENQMEAIGGLLKGAGVSSEFRNLLNKTIDYYCKFQNNHVKHDDSISPYEVSFVVEWTCILMKQMIEQFDQPDDEIEEENFS